jgi:hypothetical protein
MTLPAKFDIDEQSTKFSEQSEMIYYIKNKVGVEDFSKSQ